MGFEPTTSTLARSHSTAELFPQEPDDVARLRETANRLRAEADALDTLADSLAEEPAELTEEGGVVPNKLRCDGRAGDATAK